MHQVGGGVGAGDRRAPLPVDLGMHQVPQPDLSADHPRPVHDQIGHGPLDVVDRQLTAIEEDAAAVGKLAAALRIERGDIQDDVDLVALFGGLQPPVSAEQSR